MGLTTAQFSELCGNLGIDPVKGIQAIEGISDPKPSKYRNKRKELDGILFDSTREAKRYMELKLRQAAGEIKDLELQPSFLLQAKQRIDGKVQRAIVYKADFQYIEDGTLVVEDAKGFRTPVYILKLKLFRTRYPHIDFREIK